MFFLHVTFHNVDNIINDSYDIIIGMSYKMEHLCHKLDHLLVRNDSQNTFQVIFNNFCLNTTRELQYSFVYYPIELFCFFPQDSSGPWRQSHAFT